MPEATPALITRLVRLPAAALLGMVWFYQKTVSPVLPAVFGPTCGCRFAPSCSHYAADAVRIHGALWGSWLALRRLLRCHPLHPGGVDPVPAPRRLACTRTPPSSVLS
jgi:putative membrane protein insertion efficiency factor